MSRDVNNELFAILKQVIPNLPDKIRRLELRMEANCVPTIECEFVVKAAVGVETHEQQFTLSAIDGSRVVR